MRRKSPQRTRRIRNAAIVGAVIGFALGIVIHSINGLWYGAVFFTLLSAGMAAAITSMTMTDYDLD